MCDIVCSGQARLSHPRVWRQLKWLHICRAALQPQESGPRLARRRHPPRRGPRQRRGFWRPYQGTCSKILSLSVSSPEYIGQLLLMSIKKNTKIKRVKLNGLGRDCRIA